MKRYSVVAAVLLFIIIPAVSAHADLDTFLSRLNTQAKADPNNFNIRLSAQFGIPLPHVEAIIRVVDSSADAFMCLQLSRMTKRDPDFVVQAYKNNKGRGWGVIAKELGIKPGSSEFHALKRGDFKLKGEPGGSAKEKGKTKGKGRNK